VWIERDRWTGHRGVTIGLLIPVVKGPSAVPSGGGVWDRWRAMLPGNVDCTHRTPVVTPDLPLAGVRHPIFLRIDPRILAIAAFNAIFGAAVAALIVSHVWSVDGDRNLRAALALAGGTFGQDRGYLYSPLAAAITLPVAAGLPSAVAIGGWFVGRLGILLAGVARETRGLSNPDRVLVAIAAVGFIPTVHDLMLGNNSILIAAAVALVAWPADGYLPGLPLGLILATVPKPALIPILIWMAVFRRRALLSAVGSAAVLSLLGLIVLGASAYAAWFQVVLHPYYLGTDQPGNLALGGLLPPILAWPLMLLTVVATLFAIRRGETPGFIACLCAGLLVSPYTMAYGAVLLLLAIRPLARVARAPMFLLAAIGSIAVVLFLPLWAGAILITTLAVPRTAWANLHQGVAT
jgi:hypothetical protein